ncbi:serine/threonine-protein kinase [Kribbella sp. CA-293567]|uniref:serine/threonine-protein kinase n=1 Tax=Kribbella sp. CA-293567 TaxID=3002436 RepID=UPI0022DD1898|nr:serine/threonine-protein kinase [Kribbella sp. CA-293567]WBQ06885.1 serine/threonine-protein kinase [Kribbella sp. CA-293567]
MRSEESDSRLLAGRYRLLELLGRGGMGVVWRARDEVLHREVAVKEILLPPELPDEERDVLRSRTLREARSAARLSDPNVVAVYDVVEEEGRPWIVMEFVRSRTLADAVRQEGPLPFRQVAKIGLQVLGALEAAHPAGVLHRDVKPSNVLLADDGRVVLTDFGIATLEGESSLTQSGTLVGSPAYIAPERVQARGAGPESDLWSLGATLYTAVEGRPPHDRGTALTTLTAAVTEPPDPPKLAGPLWPALEGLLRKDPADRLKAPAARRLLQQAATAVSPPTAGSSAAPGSAASESTAPGSGPVGAAASGSTVPGSAPSDHGQGTRVLPVAPAAAQAAAAPAPVAPAAARAAAAPAPVVEPASPAAPAAPAAPATSAPSAAPAVATSSGRWGSKASAGLAAAVLLAAGLGAWTAFGPEEDSKQGEGQSPGASSAAPTAAPSTQTPRSTPTASEKSSAPQSSAPQSTVRSPSVSSPPSSRTTEPSTPPGAVPAGFRRHTDPTGFSLAVPSNWTVRREGGRVYFREPGGSRLLLIDQTDQPKADPVADWRQQEQARRDGYPAYRRIRLEAVDYFQKAADWEFSYGVKGGRQHVLNRGVVTSPDQAYGIYWSTPDGQWAASQDTLRAITASFRPAS